MKFFGNRLNSPFVGLDVVLPRHLIKVENFYNLLTDKEFADWNRVSTPTDVIIPNTGLRVKADLRTVDSGFGMEVICSEGLGVEFDGKFYNIGASNRSLLMMISWFGLDHEHYLNGTYYLTKKYNGGPFFLIPTTTREGEEVKRITDIYHDGSNFTSKMIPGHAYISRGGIHYLYLGSADLYQKDSTNLNMYGLFGRLYNFSYSPKKGKIFVPLFNHTCIKLESDKYKTVQDIFLDWSLSMFCTFRSEKFRGKDLGQCFSDDGSSLSDVLVGKPGLKFLKARMWFIDEFWRKDNEALEMLKDSVKDDNIDTRGNAELKMLIENELKL